MHYVQSNSVKKTSINFMLYLGVVVVVVVMVNPTILKSEPIQSTYISNNEAFPIISVFVLDDRCCHSLSRIMHACMYQCMCTRTFIGMHPRTPAPVYTASYLCTYAPIDTRIIPSIDGVIPVSFSIKYNSVQNMFNSVKICCSIISLKEYQCPHFKKNMYPY
jgi:hypothetical protein